MNVKTVRYCTCWACAALIMYIMSPYLLPRILGPFTEERGGKDLAGLVLKALVACNEEASAASDSSLDRVLGENGSLDPLDLSLSEFWRHFP